MSKRLNPSLFPPNWASAPYRGSSPRLAPLCPPPDGAGWRGWLKPPTRAMEMLPGHCEEGPAPPGREQRSRLSSAPGPVVYLQPELFTSATGPDLRRGDTRTGPRPRLHPGSPGATRALPGKEGTDRGVRELSHSPILLHTQHPSCPTARSSSPPRRIRPRRPPFPSSLLEAGGTPSPKGHPCQPK